jgi:hypothetical protein
MANQAAKMPMISILTFMDYSLLEKSQLLNLLGRQIAFDPACMPFHSSKYSLPAPRPLRAT